MMPVDQSNCFEVVPLLFQFIIIRASSVRWQFHKGCPLIRAIVSRFYHYSFNLLFYELVQFVGSFIKAAH